MIEKKSADANDINSMLRDWSNGNRKNEDQLIKILYPEIHRIAHFQMKLNSSRALQTTEIVSEAFLRLNSQQSINWKNKEHFLAIAAKVIRRVVVDYYRSEMSLKRGGNDNHVTLSGVAEMLSDAQNNEMDWLELNDLIEQLNLIDEEAAAVVELKIFGGMTLPEMAEVMAVSESTVSRNWKFARTWILQQLG